jgi:hypothetical protein
VPLTFEKMKAISYPGGDRCTLNDAPASPWRRHVSARLWLGTAHPQRLLAAPLSPLC